MTSVKSTRRSPEHGALAIAETIREAGSIPSGHLWAAAMSHMSFDEYERIIALLTGAGLIRSKNHLLTWIEGAPQEDAEAKSTVA